ncbi:hypothetical protein Dsin_003746 [Dipteronia sinensis]|uniref:Uncharacterized protein n=1 Tax=Dipteronia sinensis TaxID=43782 RepID=A0AAE0EMF7_9ROSI|nr:hypothetical protein Dsin_003746 [Dipteronia sinensis]
MNLKLKDMAAEKDKVNEIDLTDLLQVAAEVGDDNENHVFDLVKPASLDDDEGNLDPHIASHARDMGINVEQVIIEEVGVDREVIVTIPSDDQHTSDENSGRKDDGDDGDGGDKARGWDSGARGWNAGATSWDVRAGSWDAGATCWNASAAGWDASAAGWDAHGGDFDQNRGRQQGGTSQIDEDSLSMTLSSMNIDTKNSSLGDSQTISSSHVLYYGSYGGCNIFDYPSPQMSYAIPIHADQQYPPS